MAQPFCRHTVYLVSLVPSYLMISRSGGGVLAQSNRRNCPQGGANSVQQVKADLTEHEAAQRCLPSQEAGVT